MSVCGALWSCAASPAPPSPHAVGLVFPVTCVPWLRGGSLACFLVCVLSWLRGGSLARLLAPLNGWVTAPFRPRMSAAWQHLRCQCEQRPRLSVWLSTPFLSPPQRRRPAHPHCPRLKLKQRGRNPPRHTPWPLLVVTATRCASLPTATCGAGVAMRTAHSDCPPDPRAPSWHTRPGFRIGVAVVRLSWHVVRTTRSCCCAVAWCLPLAATNMASVARVLWRVSPLHARCFLWRYTPTVGVLRRRLLWRATTTPLWELWEGPCFRSGECAATASNAAPPPPSPSCGVCSRAGVL